MRSDLLRFDGVSERNPAIDAWFDQQQGPLGEIARYWFGVMRQCGDEVREGIHDGCPVACFGDFPFAYANVFSAHVNVGFLQGSSLPDPKHLLRGTGKYMRHVKLEPGTAIDQTALRTLIEKSYAQMKARVESD